MLSLPSDSILISHSCRRSYFIREKLLISCYCISKLVFCVLKFCTKDLTLSGFKLQVSEGKLMTEKKEIANGELKTQKSSEVSPDKIKETASPLSGGDMKILEDAKGPTLSVPEVTANGAANAC